MWLDFIICELFISVFSKNVVVSSVCIHILLTILWTFCVPNTEKFDADFTKFQIPVYTVSYSQYRGLCNW
jgi:hypothetical protein